MASANAVTIIEVCHVSPSNNANELSLPLTPLDMPFIKALPKQRLYFYESSHLSLTHFLDSIIPSLKKSLSVTLSHFLPLAGNLTWPSHCPEPIIQYAPGDSIPFIVADSNHSANFDILSSYDVQAAGNTFPFLPELVTSDARASILALQVTLFPNKGFCVGLVSHHAVLDGQSATLFVKAWSYICRQSQECNDFTALPPELSPYFNRDVIRDVATKASFDLLVEPDSRSLKLSNYVEYSDHNLVRAIFTITQADINNLKRKVMTWQQREGKQALNASTFVVTSAYVSSCLLKAYKPEGKRAFYLSFGSDLRARLKPPIPKNYFGNCLGVGGIVKIEDRDLSEEDGIATLAEKIAGEIKEIDDRIWKDKEWWLSKIAPLFDPGHHVINVSGSPRFEVYGIDYGWGKPKKVEIVSVDRNAGLALNQNRDQNGGVEVSFVLGKKEMEIFHSLLDAGLRMAS